MDPSNPLYALVKAGHVEYIHTDTDLMFFAPSQPALPTEESNYYWKVVWDLLDEAQEYAAEHRDQIPEDMSFLEWLTQYLDARQSDNSNEDNYMSEKLKQAVRGLSMYWADENAIPLERVSMKYMDAEEIFPGEHCLVHNGFDRVVKVLVDQLKDVTVLLDHAVNRVEYDGKRKEGEKPSFLRKHLEWDMLRIANTLANSPLSRFSKRYRGASIHQQGTLHRRSGPCYCTFGSPEGPLRDLVLSTSPCDQAACDSALGIRDHVQDSSLLPDLLLA